MAPFVLSQMSLPSTEVSRHRPLLVETLFFFLQAPDEEKAEEKADLEAEKATAAAERDEAIQALDIDPEFIAVRKYICDSFFLTAWTQRRIEERKARSARQEQRQQNLEERVKARRNAAAQRYFFSRGVFCCSLKILCRLQTHISERVTRLKEVRAWRKVNSFFGFSLFCRL